MDPISDGCRLCLDRFAECFTTIDNPQLKDQMEKVFCFSIEPKQGYCSGVCQSCSYAVSEFYQYSEKVRQNQELLDNIVPNSDPILDPTEDSNDALEGIKIEILSDTELPEKTEGASEPKDEVQGEDVVPDTGEGESCEPLPNKSQTNRKGREPTKITKQTIMRIQQERNEQDRLISKHIRMICNLCGTAEATFTELVNHFWKAHKRRNGYIVCCNKKLFKRFAILDHIDSHANPDGFLCEVCDKNYKSKFSLNRHMRYKHPTAGPFKCDLCPLSFSHKYDLSVHKRWHVKAECPKCDKTFSRKSTLSRHMINQHSGKSRSLVCDTCGKEFLNKIYFDRHQLRHTNEAMGIKSERSNRMKGLYASGTRKIQCDICLQKYPNSRALYRHKLHMHPEPKHECEFCGKKFKKANTLKDHRVKHTGQVQRIQCEICQRWLKCERTFHNHMIWVHSNGNREVQCNICQQMYPHARALYDHKLRTHAERKYECEFCGKKFKMAIYLKEHRTSHTGENLHPCEYCGRPNSRRQSLYQHMKRKHPTEWAQMQLVKSQETNTLKIESKQGYCSSVCQSCSYAISEFYQFSEKVRQNQELLNGSVTSSDPTVDSKPIFESIKVEPLSDSFLPEPPDDVCKPKDEDLRDEEVPNSADDESYEPPPKKSPTKRKELTAGLPKSTKQTSMKSQQVRNEEDQLFNKHIRMICDLCGTSAMTFTVLLSHFRKVHQRRDGYVMCCNKKLFKRCAILDHINVHVNPDVFRCEVCDKKYKHKDSLNAHMLTHSNADQQPRYPFNCDYCGQGFAQKFVLAQHIKRHMKVKCTKCNKMFACMDSLRTHKNNQHSGKNRTTMVCETCGQEFLSKQCFDRHKDKHMGVGEQKVQCAICQRWLKGERSLRNHLNWVHSDNAREFQCDICQQNYPHSRALYLHKLQTHAEPKHECEFCGKKFKKAIALKEHRTTHTGEVLYTCKYCNIPNNSKANLYVHIKRQHPTEWEQKQLEAAQRSSSS